MVFSRRKTAPVRIIVLAGVWLMMLILALACGRAFPDLKPGSAQEGFPDTDIVYATGAALGFVNADGSSATTLPFELWDDLGGNWQSPLMVGDGKTILVTYTTVPGRRGKIFAVQAGKNPVECRWDGTLQLAADGSHVLVDTGDAVRTYLPVDCGTEGLPGRVYSGTSGAISPDQQYVAEVKGGQGGLEEYIAIRHLQTGEERKLGNGDFPVWSRDGEWLAYTGVDGIYIFHNIPGAESSRLVEIEGPEPNSDMPLYQDNVPIQYYPPVASWSPDGQWLVYHVYSSSLAATKVGGRGQYYSIFKVNVKTGETTRLVDGGYSPFWRWPAEKP